MKKEVIKKKTIKKTIKSIKSIAKDEFVLLFDVGGTFTRIAVSKNKKIISTKIIETKEFKLEDIKKIIEENKNSKQNISSIIMACAGLVKNGKAQLTNASLFFDEKALSIMLNVPVKLINDLEAVGYALSSKNKNSLIIGLGTGLGISIIDGKGNIIPSEEGHLSIDRELFLSIPELRNTIIPQYENVLGAKNILMKIMKKDGKIILQKDRFTEIYLQILNSIIQKLLTVHKDVKIKKIIFVSGIAASNKNFLEKYSTELKKKFKTEIEIIDDKFIGIKGANVFAEKIK